MPKKYTVLETWIVNTLKPAESNSAEQTFDRMEKQSGGKLPVVDFPQDLHREADFLDEAWVRDFAAHLGSAGDVLDIGPGDGWPLLRLAPLFRNVTGVEPAPRRVEAIRANAERLGLKNVAVHQASAAALEFADASFDGVVAASSIEQTPDPFAALREVFRVLKPGGRFRVTFETHDTDERGFTEAMSVSETADSLGYHYVISHHSPPWERNYLVKLGNTPEAKEEFRRLADLVERLGSNPSANPEVGLQFLERNQATITGASWYELEHFTSRTMKETLMEIGFVNVRVTQSAAALARVIWPRLKDAGLEDQQAQQVCQGLADIALKLESSGAGDPVVATKPS